MHCRLDVERNDHCASTTASTTATAAAAPTSSAAARQVHRATRDRLEARPREVEDPFEALLRGSNPPGSVLPGRPRDPAEP